MSQDLQTELQAKTQGLLQGPLKHIRGAALAAALLPLASIAAAPASAQTLCPSGGVCGIVFDDSNNNGIRDGGEPGIEGVKITICQLCDGSDNVDVESGPDGSYTAFVPGGPTKISVLIPTGTMTSPPNVGGDDTIDSDGVSNGSPYSVVVLQNNGFANDFGFFTPPTSQPGTGTPGYWKNHPEAWPVSSIVAGGITYTKAQAIAWLGKVGKDKTTTMFSSLVPAMLNVIIGNLDSCVTGAINDGNKWMKYYGPVGSGVAGGSYAWSVGEPTHQQLDAYNNGLLCAPHRQ